MSDLLVHETLELDLKAGFDGSNSAGETLSVGKIFTNYETFTETFELYQRNTSSVFRIDKSITVQAENLRRQLKIPDDIVYSYVSHVCVRYGKPKVTVKENRPKQR